LYVTIVALATVSLLVTNVLGQATTTFTNPSVIPGSEADLHGPRVATVNYPIFTSDHASLEALIGGQTQIMDFPPSQFSDIQTALATKYLNVTTGTGSGEEFIYFNTYSPKVPGYDLHFRQAVEHLIDYGYIQTTVLNGVQGVATPNILLPSAFGQFSTSDITTYPYSLPAANASLASDSYLKWNPTAVKPSSSNTIACDGSPGVWQWSDGSSFTPIFITRPDHPTWLVETEKIWHDAAKIGLCFDMEQKTGFGSVFPIVFKQYSNNWAMYFGGVGFSSPLDGISDLFYAYTKDPGWTNPFLNTDHYYNDTLDPILHDMFSTTDVSRAQSDSQQAVKILSQQIPTLDMWWDSILIPSLNNYNGQYWTGYVNTPAYSTWTFATGFWTLLNVHQIDPVTGSPKVGGTFTVGLHEAPDDLNIFQAESVYDLDVLGSLYDSPMVPLAGNPSLSGIVPWAVTGVPTVNSGVTTTTPHGYKIVNGMTMTLNFMNNITFHDNVRMTASDFNFSLWYENLNGATYNATTGQCSAPCWTQYAADSSAIYTGTLPDLTDSVVNSPTSVTVFMNGTGLEDWKGIVLNPILPQHLWSQVNSTKFNSDIDPTTNSTHGALLVAGTGPFIFGKWVRSQYITIDRNPGYFRTDIRDWSLAAPAGSSVPLSVTLLQQGSPIPSTASVTATVLQNGQPTGATATLSPAGSVWNGTLSTASLSPGFYEIVVNGTYSDNSGLSHEALQFWGLNVGGAITTTTSTSVGPSAAAGLPTYTIAGAVIVVLIVIGIVVYVVRRPKSRQEK
jgi:ABC-type transport system substrate-binding protein